MGNIKIAVIEDDENLRFLVASRLEKEGYIVFEAENGKEGVALILEKQPDIVLLDWMMPVKSGSEVCQEVRDLGFLNPIIMITAKDQDLDKIDAYNFGITDYIIKPFSMDVLVANIYNKVKYSTEKQEHRKFNGFEHHPNIHLLISENGTRVELTIFENRILLYLLQHENQVVTREELLAEVWGYNSAINTRTLDMHIVRLRKKIEENSENPKLLQTVRGQGYKLSC